MADEKERAQLITTICSISGVVAMDVEKDLFACLDVSPSLLSLQNANSSLVKSDKVLLMCANDDEEHREFEKVALFSADEVRRLCERDLRQSFTFDLDGRFKYSYGERCVCLFVCALVCV